MSEELLKRGLVKNPEKIGKWDFYNIGETNIKSLKDSQILNPISTPNLDRRKPDGIIVDKGKLVALISNKLPARLKRDKEVQDWIEVTKGLGSRLLIVCDGNTRTFWINALTGDTIKDEQGNDLKKHFDPRDEEVPALIERILESIDEHNSSLIKPEHKDPTNLAKSVWQDIWSAAGDDPENCLYTFVELFIFKYLSDLEILKGMYSFEELLKKYETNKPEEVLEYYADTIRKEIKKQFKENPVDRTTIINGSTFINKQGEAVKGYSTVFKKVLKQFKEYEKRNGKFSHIHREFESKIFETFLKESISKKNWGQYFTPLKVVRAIAKMAASEIRDGITVCDPACGVGKFLLEIIADDPKRFFRFEKGKLKRSIVLVGYDKGFADKEQKTIILAKANMLIYLWELLRENPSACEQFSTGSDASNRV
jgi:type I restriction enzyme M protein